MLRVARSLRRPIENITTRHKQMRVMNPCPNLAVQSIHCTPRVLSDENKKPLELVGDNIVTRLYKKVFSGVPMAKLKASGYILVTHCTQGIDVVGFFETFDMPDTFYSWFLVAELHIWLLGVRFPVQSHQIVL